MGCFLVLFGGMVVIFTFLYPNTDLNVMFLPIGFKAKYLVTFLFILEVVLSFIPGGSISHWGHIGGALTGPFFILF
jgi:membrane associated rhomboid family serine protease